MNHVPSAPTHVEQPKIEVHSWPFGGFVFTQFLGAFNDSAFKFAIQVLAYSVILSQEARWQYVCVAMVIFTAPFILFSTYAGAVADRLSKRTVIIASKCIEVTAMLLGVLAFWSGEINYLLVVLFLMSTQSAIFSPAKYGMMPEMLPPKRLAYGNGILEMSTFVAIIMGTVFGGFIFDTFRGNLPVGALFFVLIALAGVGVSFSVPRVRPSGSVKPIHWNFLATMWEDYKVVRAIPALPVTILGIAFFYFVAALVQLGIIFYAMDLLKLTELQTSYLTATLAIGIGAGSFLAGRISRNRIELGLVPVGAVGISACLVALYFTKVSLTAVYANFILLGLMGGLFIVPLMALLQHLSPRTAKGKVVAFSNVITNVAILLSAVTLILTTLVPLQADQVFLLLGLLTLLFTGIVLWRTPLFLIRFLLLVLVSTIYRVKITGMDGLPERGPVLIVSNHLSYMDVVVISACTPRFIRYMMYRPFYEWKLMNWFFKSYKVIPVNETDSPKQVRDALKQVAALLAEGEAVLVFAEGELTRTGEMGEFKRGFELALAMAPKELDIPVVPLYLGGLWGSIFSWEGGKCLWKWPKRFPYHVSLTFGEPLPRTAKAKEVEAIVRGMAAATPKADRAQGDLPPMDERPTSSPGGGERGA